MCFEQNGKPRWFRYGSPRTFGGRAFTASYRGRFIRQVKIQLAPGAISECVVADLDGDTRQEVLLGGMNNPGQGLGHAALAVLQLPFPSPPRHPTNQEFAPLTGCGELAHLLFPEPDAARVAGLTPPCHL